MKNIDLGIQTLGRATIRSPLSITLKHGDDAVKFTSDDERILYDPSLKNFIKHNEDGTLPPSFEIAGPSENIYFDPSKTKSAIVTCGGLCPGINDVIRALVMELYYRYDAKNILGIRYGYQGFIPEYGHELVDLNPDLVEDIHEKSGTILGSSRGDQDKDKIVDSLERLNINILFCIGGDGTLKGAHTITNKIRERNLKISVIGVPKTIDNDINFVEKTFGFETAFSKAVDSIKAGHTEAKGAFNGISLLKVMGRHSGYIAANAALALNDVNFVLIPEIRFDLEGENGLFELLKNRLTLRRHAVVVVAEGAGQEHIHKDTKNIERDASGNIKLVDIGPFLKGEIEDYFKKIEMEITLKYIDPSYIIRSMPANANDSIFCGRLAQNAVHAAMAGKTDMVVGLWNGYFTHVPLKAAISRRNVLSPQDPLWLSVIEATGQPVSMTN